MVLVFLAGWLSLIHPLVVAAEENGDPFLRESPFQKMVVFYNPAQQRDEVRIFEDAEFDDEKNVIFRMEKQVPLVLPTNRIQVIFPVAPEGADEFSLIELKKGLEDCSKVKNKNSEVNEMIAKWRDIVSKKEKQIEAERHQDEERQSKAIQDAALEKAAEELATARNYVDNYDRLARRQQMEEGLSFLSRLNPQLFENEVQLEKARRYWEVILLLPPQVPIPTQWPFPVPADQFMKTTSEEGQIPTKPVVMAVFFGLVICNVAFISWFFTAFRNQAWLIAILLGGLSVVFLGLLIAVFFSTPKSSGGVQVIFFEKADWSDKALSRVALLRSNEEIQIETSLSLGSSFYSLPFKFTFNLGQADTPSSLRINKASVGAIPLPKQAAEWLWSQLSTCYAWVD